MKDIRGRELYLSNVRLTENEVEERVVVVCRKVSQFKVGDDLVFDLQQLVQSDRAVQRHAVQVLLNCTLYCICNTDKLKIERAVIGRMLVIDRSRLAALLQCCCWLTCEMDN